jgi:alkyl hydroperoxide reductase subunit AhpF
MNMAVSIDSLMDKSPLITDELEEQLNAVFASLDRQVTVTCIMDDSDKSMEMAVFLKHLTGLSNHLVLRLLDPGTEKDADEALCTEYLPATGLHTDRGYAGAVFHGVPGGHELTGFVSAILAAGGAAKPLDAPTLREINKIRGPVTLYIAVSLGCHHCAATVVNAQKIANASPAVRVHTIDANLYPDLVEKYSIERVPMLIIGGKVVGQTEMTVPELCGIMRKA